ncbi:MAG TPA: HU family DNA-binding protein [Nitrospiraceae bacterium]|jgi:hypothetical protein|nr:HU family DNA-binding protein [Nitrospiraceae bacterium]
MASPRRPLGPPFKQPLARAGLIIELAKATGLSEYKAALVLRELEDIVVRSLIPESAREFVLPGLLRIDVDTIPAKPPGETMNPFTNEVRRRDATPEKMRIKIRAAAKLKNALHRAKKATADLPVTAD